MKTTSDPSIHRQQERQIIQHVEKLLSSPELRIDTTQGHRPVVAFTRDVTRADQAVELRRMMSDLNLPDRELAEKMPIGESLDVVLSARKLFFFNQPVGRLRVVCVSPAKSLLKGETPSPMTLSELQKVLSGLPQGLKGVPSTNIIVSTSGFTLEAHELADRRPDRTVVLVEPGPAGGWKTTGPIETKSLNDLFDPEAEEEKRERLRERVRAARTQLAGAGIASDKIAVETGLPVQMVEQELKAFAKANAGHVAKRLDGRVVLFREGSALSDASRADAGGAAMPLIDRMKALFGLKGETSKKVSFLSERRAALSQQRDRSYEEMGALEQQENELRTEFKEAGSNLTKRRITSQLLQLRKDIERRQQLLTVLNQQVNVVSTHLHNLELVQQGQTAKLPDTEQITADAVEAEEMLAQLEADNELASSVGASATSGMSAEEQALFEELEAENAPPAAGEAAGADGAPAAATPRSRAATAAPPASSSSSTPASSPAARRPEPEAG